ncbi:MaoC family dehydratase N-terminal domain-containing protein [Streptomyces sp. CSDS2]|uniref:FAS1-like dehydratase domain-containing protein n=1 Tax=Streptomyces sp. CSDS2 TaxID=3055051 RepID=UPI0025AFDCD7|nr:MaoC family dehydratase N-terminal domain-containing protein [Streptomyces sp. CSDS2]MDN3259821.1 MaoC family dehydratase N-terminal domain-containing protein [Streptomyces sp. CSDS2]
MADAMPTLPGNRTTADAAATNVRPGFVPGTRLPSFTVTVERGRLRFFSGLIGPADTEFTSLERARAAGHRDLPVPPTFLFGLELEHQTNPAGPEGPSVEPRRILHTEQSFVYHTTAYAGDDLVFSPVITNVYRRRGGTMEFIVRDTAVTRTDGMPVADLHQVIMVRHPEASR